MSNSMGQLSQSQQDAIDQKQAGSAYNSSVSQTSRETAIDATAPPDLETTVGAEIQNSGGDSFANEDMKS